MGFRFFRRWNILPGISLNLSKSGPSISFGTRGARITVGAKGVRGTVGIPGTGFYYTKQILGSGKRGGARSKSDGFESDPKTGGSSSLARPEDQSLWKACRALADGDPATALEHARRAEVTADGCFIGGLAAMANGDPQEAVRLLSRSLVDPRKLGETLGRLGADFSMRVPIAEGVQALVRPDAEGAMLALAEACQQAGRTTDAIGWMERLLAAMPDDAVARLSLAELLIENSPDSHAAWNRVLALTEGASGQSAIGCGLLLYRARALRRLGRPRDAALAATQALRVLRGRPPELLRELRYERALASLDLGETERARVDLRRVFEEDPYFEDVADRLRRLDSPQAS